MVSWVTVEAERMSGKTHMLTGFAANEAERGSRVLFVTLNWNLVRHHHKTVSRVLPQTAKSYFTHMEQRVEFPSGGVLWFVSAGSRRLGHFSADTVILDEFDFYDNQEDVVDTVTHSDLSNGFFYKTRTLPTKDLI